MLTPTLAPPTTPFTHGNVNLPHLREHAYNYRWAEQPYGVIPLTAADSDFPIAPQITAALTSYLHSGYLPYGPAAGLPQFRAVAADTLHTQRGIPYTADHIFTVNSAASALYLTAKYTLNPGDEALIPDPVDFLFERSVVAAGGTVKRFPLHADQNYSFDPAEIEALITPKTKLLTICNPHNPLGRVWTHTELEQLANIALRHNLWIMSDEVWADIIYKPHKHTSTAALSPEIGRRTFSIFGFSKGYGLAGLRLGLLACPTAEIQQEIAQLSHADETAYGVSTLSQIAGIAAYQEAGDWLTQFVTHLQTQRDYAVGRLNTMSGVTCHAPEGTFVLFPDVSALGLPATTLVNYLQEKCGLALVPGSPKFFGPGAAGHLRLSFATSHQILTTALDRLEAGLRWL